MNPAARQYAKTQTETASKERMMVLLFQHALRQIRAGAAALEASQASEAASALGRANEIVCELHATLDVKAAPQMCEQLGELYRFVSARLVAAMCQRDPKPAREAERVFAPLVDAFGEAVEKIAREPEP